MGLPLVCQIAANPKEKKNLSSSLEKFTTVGSTFSSTPPYQVARLERAEYIAICFRTERLDGGLRYLSDLQGLQGERL